MAILGFTACGNNNQKELEKQAAALNATTPIMLDQMTRLDKVEALSGMTLKFSVTMVGIDKEMFDVINTDGNIANMVKQQMVASVKANPGFAEIKKLGATFIYDFKDEAGHPLFDVTIAPADYK